MLSISAVSVEPSSHIFFLDLALDSGVGRRFPYGRYLHFNCASFLLPLYVINLLSVRHWPSAPAGSLEFKIVPGTVVSGRRKHTRINSATNTTCNSFYSAAWFLTLWTYTFGTSRSDPSSRTHICPPAVSPLFNFRS